MSKIALPSRTITFGCAAAISGAIWSRTRSAFPKNIRPSTRSINKPGYVSSSGCSSERRRKTLVSGLRASSYTAGLLAW